MTDANRYRFNHQRNSQKRRRSAWLLYIAMVLFVLSTVVVFRQVMLPFVFALIIVYLLAPLVDILERRGMPRWGGVITCYTLVILLGYGAVSYLSPKLRTESVKVLKTFRGIASEVPGLFDQAGAEVVAFLDKLEGKEGLSGPGNTQRTVTDESRWGFGPSIIPVPVYDGGYPPGAAHLTFTADDIELGKLSAASEERSEEEVDAAKADAQVVFSQISDGVYGLRVNESTLEIKDVGDGTYTLIPHTEPLEGSNAQSLRNKVISNLRGSLERFGGRIVGGAVKLVGNIVGIASNAIVALVVVFMVAAFMLIDLGGIMGWFQSRIPFKYRDEYDDLLARLDDGLSGVIRGQLMICLINGVLSGIGFVIFIPDYALVFAVFAGVMSIIPIFGTIISTVPAVLIGLTVSWGTAMAVLIWILAIHALEANVLNPKIIATQARLSPVLVVFSLVAGESAFGLTGALLAVPVLSVTHSIMGFMFKHIRGEIIGPANRV